jgi:predicted acetyltransferase
MTDSAKLRFEEPHAALERSYRELVAEFVNAGEELIPFPLRFDHEDFGAFLAELTASSRGEGISERFVPHTTYWLVAGDEVVAVANLRHRLTPQLESDGGHIGYGVRPSARRRGYATAILRYALQVAKGRGIRRALVTCNKRNVGSARTIIANGGVLDSEEPLGPDGEVIQRYYIEL